MLCLPTVRFETVSVAWLRLMLIGAWAVPSIVKVTVPVAPVDTLAVNMTACPKAEGLGEETRLVVEVATEFTVWVSGLVVAGEKFESPL